MKRLKFEVVMDVMDDFDANIILSTEVFDSHGIITISQINDKTREERNKAWTREAFDLVNWMGNWDDLADVLIKKLRTEHNTLKQSFFRMIHKVIKAYSKHEYFDARNEASVRWAKEVAELDGYFPHI